jgi:hypothetical protein
LRVSVVLLSSGAVFWGLQVEQGAMPHGDAQVQESAAWCVFDPDGRAIDLSPGQIQSQLDSN